MSEGPTRSQFFDHWYRVLASKLLNMDWTRFNTTHPADCCPRMGCLPWEYELQLIERIQELIPAMPADRWERMSPYNHRRISILKAALRRQQSQPITPKKRGPKTTLMRDLQWLQGFEQWQVDNDGGKEDRYRQLFHPGVNRDTFAKALGRARKANRRIASIL